MKQTNSAIFPIQICVFWYFLFWLMKVLSQYFIVRITLQPRNLKFSSLSTSATHTRHDISTLNWKYCQKQRTDCFQYCFLLNLKFFFRWTAPRYVSHHIQIFAPTTNLFHIFFIAILHDYFMLPRFMTIEKRYFELLFKNFI